MARTYTMKARAEKQAETRRRIVEAAVDLHGSIGPVGATVSMIAEHAGVQRHTFYAHFPDERSLLMACSGLVGERDPLPDATDWRAVEDPRERLRGGLRALYDWYARNAGLAAAVLRDAESHALVREIVELRWGPPLAALAEMLGEGLDAERRALLQVAMSFHTWRTLVKDAGLEQGQAVEVMAGAVMREGAQS